ncbi:hypothetical protein PHMEG_00017295 [Phytophthora megakarya]|uniref:Uncharacterized protein n=1 Tax=Phytophthora megakarya TaxID=4795 RepID=A0A225VWV7_9STRA|nr:hypothetical protein PHMEG_00017295 [Phytophthora megakarya]
MVLSAGSVYKHIPCGTIDLVTERSRHLWRDISIARNDSSTLWVAMSGHVRKPNTAPNGHSLLTYPCQATHGIYRLLKEDVGSCADFIIRKPEMRSARCGQNMDI